MSKGQEGRKLQRLIFQNKNRGSYKSILQDDTIEREYETFE